MKVRASVLKMCERTICDNCRLICKRKRLSTTF